MQSLIDFILRQLSALWPIARVYEWDAAFMVRNGRITRELATGLHWRWWFIEEMRRYPKRECTVDLESAAITTSDGVAVALSANLSYEMVDISKCWRNVWNLEVTMAKTALGRLCSSSSRRSYEQLMARGTESELLAEMQRELGEPWGIRFTRLHLTDCVRLRAHRHYMDGMKT